MTVKLLSSLKLHVTIIASVFKHSRKVLTFQVFSQIELPQAQLPTEGALKLVLARIFALSYFRDVFVQVKEALNSQVDIIRAFTLTHVLGRIQPVTKYLAGF